MPQPRGPDPCARGVTAAPRCSGAGVARGSASCTSRRARRGPWSAPSSPARACACGGITAPKQFGPLRSGKVPAIARAPGTTEAESSHSAPVTSACRLGRRPSSTRATARQARPARRRAPQGRRTGASPASTSPPSDRRGRKQCRSRAPSRPSSYEPGALRPANRWTRRTSPQLSRMPVGEVDLPGAFSRTFWSTASPPPRRTQNQRRRRVRWAPIL